METLTTTQTAAQLRRAVTRLNRRLRSSSLGGISPTQASMLASIEKLDCPSLGDLAQVEQVQPPSVTRVIRRLEEAGFVESWRDAQDRRCTRVRLTPGGHLELEAIRQRKTEFLEKKLLSLSPADLAVAQEMVAFLERLVDEA